MPNFYYDFPVVRAAARAAIASAVLAGVDSPTVKEAASTAALSAMSAMEQSGARAAVRGGEADALAHAETVAARGAASAGSFDSLRMRERTAVIAGAGTSVLSTSVGIDAPAAFLRSQVQAREALAAIDAPAARSAGQVSARNAVSASELAEARGALGTSAIDRPKIREVVTARAAGSVSLSLLRAIVEEIGVSAGRASSVEEQLAATDTSSVRSRMAVQAVAPFRFDIGNLVRNVRANAQAALPECLSLPEALPDALLFKAGLQIPFLILLFAQPEPSSDWAVNDVAQTIKCEFIYVAHTVSNGITDMPQHIRTRLARLEQVLIADYRQMAGSGAPSCNNTMLVASPAQRANLYQQYLTDNGQKATALSTVLEFTVLASRIGA